MQEDGMGIAYLAIEYLVAKWLDRYPASESAQQILQLNMFAARESHFRFIYDVWTENLDDL